MPETREVRTVEVLDPVTIIVTPERESDSLYGEEFTVHIDNLDAPQDGDCGLDEATAAATSIVGDSPWFLRYDGVDKIVYIDDDEHYGELHKRTGTYDRLMISDGYGHPLQGNDNPSLDDREAEAQSSNAGLWASCPDFGA